MVTYGVAYSVIVGNVDLQQHNPKMIYNPPQYLGCSGNSKNFTGYHALSAVGWGHDEESDIDYAIMRNSWGTDWGDDGYFKLALRDDW